MASRRHLAYLSLLLLIMNCLFTVCNCRPAKTHRESALASSPGSSDVLMTLLKEVVLSRRRRWSRDDVDVPYEAAHVQRPFSRRHRTSVFRSRHAPRVAFHSSNTQAADRGGWGGAYGR